MNLVQQVKSYDWQRLKKSLKYSFYIITHPFDGFWDLTHEKRGSMAAANILLLLLALCRVFELQYTSFLFMTVHWQYINMLIEVLAIVLPILLWCVANWSLTTLLDGKGKLKEIYMGTVYAFTPKILIGYSLILLSNVITLEEGVLYMYLQYFATIWSVFLVISAMMMIHDYSFSKAILSSLATIVGVGVIVFIFTLFFSLISDGVAYFVSLYKEIIFRLS
ncbi:YIP1 family protein [Lachnoclostridium sp.]|uniref:YIP1 family protein n=1 Tax=Lachnoclostridium sp. TaxID=2028282 RepID=UPI0028A0272F|nr:YIP1 family protein [Lachnoclostridium sp.]